MACQCAPALLKLRDEINARWPDRDKTSDGCCASAMHTLQNPTSDHEPVDGYAHAYDFDEDLDADTHSLMFLLPVLFADSRTKYVIYEARIYYPDGTSKAYSGLNPHDKHLHLSIKATATFETRSWLTALEDDMPTAEEVARATVDLLNKEGTAFGLLGFGATVVESLNVGRQNANALAVLLSRDPDSVTAADVAAAIPDGLAQDVAEALAQRLAD